VTASSWSEMVGAVAPVAVASDVVGACDDDDDDDDDDHFHDHHDHFHDHPELSPPRRSRPRRKTER